MEGRAVRKFYRFSGSDSGRLVPLSRSVGKVLASLFTPGDPAISRPASEQFQVRTGRAGLD